jgi:hypothetical protein
MFLSYHSQLVHPRKQIEIGYEACIQLSSATLLYFLVFLLGSDFPSLFLSFAGYQS